MYFLDKRLAQKIPGTPAFQEKQKKEHEEMEITRINQDLQRVVGRFQKQFDKESNVFLQSLAKANRHVASSTILHLGYRNNFENGQVAVDTMTFLLTMANELPEEEKKQLVRAIQSPKQRFARIQPLQARELDMLERKITKKDNRF